MLEFFISKMRIISLVLSFLKRKEENIMYHCIIFRTFPNTKGPLKLFATAKYLRGFLYFFLTLSNKIAILNTTNFTSYYQPSINNLIFSLNKYAIKNKFYAYLKKNENKERDNK